MTATTTDGKMVIPGEMIFRLADQDGFPIWASLDEAAKWDAVIDWTGYIKAAREAGWWDFQTIDKIIEAVHDANLEGADQIIDRCKMFMMLVPQDK